MNRQRCIREVCRNGLAPHSRAFVRSRPLVLETRIGVQFYSTLKLSQTVIQSSETIPPSIPFDIQPLKVNSSQTSKIVGIVPLPSIPFPSTSVFFQYYAQRTSLDKAPELLYANSIGTANYQLSRMKGQVLGLDLEWRVQGPVNVSLVQICDEHKIILLHLTTMKGQFPRALKDILEDPTRIKCGVNIKNDASRLVTCFSVIPRGLVELGEFAQTVHQSRWSSIGVTRKIIALEKLALMYLPKPLKKGMGAFSPWDHNYLSAEAKLYAANDCYAAWKVFQMLEAFRVVEGVEMPPLIDYRDSVGAKNRKRRRKLLESMRIMRTEGGRCLAMINELINLKRTRLNMGDDFD